MLRRSAHLAVFTLAAVVGYGYILAVGFEPYPLHPLVKATPLTLLALLALLRGEPQIRTALVVAFIASAVGDYLLGVCMMQERGLQASINLGGGFNDEITRTFEELAEFSGFPKNLQKYMYGQYLVTPHVPLPTRGAVGAVYKLAQTGRRPTMKFSNNLEKSSIPGKPVAFRLRALDGAETRQLPVSVVGQEGERPPKGYFQLTGADPEAVFFDHLSPAVLARFRQPQAVGLSPATAALVARLQAERHERAYVPEDS